MINYFYAKIPIFYIIDKAIPELKDEAMMPRGRNSSRHFYLEGFGIDSENICINT